MQDAEGVGGGQGVAHRDADACHLGDGQWSVVANQLEQRLGRHELHHDPWQPILDDHVEDGDHIRVAA